MNDLTRRTFLTASTAASAGFFAGCATSKPRKVSPNAKICHACIGVGGMGYNDFQNFKSHPRAQLVALCDVDRTHLEKAAREIPGVRTYTDWRELFAKEGDRIDSVNVAVPDHNHAIMAMAAIRAGKHVYCQKPLCHDVAECRLLTEAVRRSNVVTQLGTQFASGVGDLMAVAWLRQGVVGKVQRVILCSNRRNAIEEWRLLGPRPNQGEVPPPSLDWNVWLGTAPFREYAPKIYHPQHWRAWQDFGTGWSGDIGCHIFDAVWKGLDLKAPLWVTATVQESWKNSHARRGDVWPQSDHITWLFPGNAHSGGRDFTVEWFDGLSYPPEDVQAMAKEAGFSKYPEEASLVIGTEGALLLPHQAGPVLLPKARFKGCPRPQVVGGNHYHHFLDACLGGERCASHFLQTGPMAEAIILGTVAVREPDQMLQWDADHVRITNSERANKLLRRSYRKGWEL